MQGVQSVLPQRPVLAEPLVDLGEGLRSQAVDTALSVISDVDKIGLAQHAQVPGDAGPRDWQQCRQLVHGHWTFRQRVEQHQSALVAQSSQHGRFHACNVPDWLRIRQVTYGVIICLAQIPATLARVRVARTRAELAAARAVLPGHVGFVPTMGALHEGHGALLQAARDDNASVVASVFVNPTQFGPNEDFARYPRDEDADLAVLESTGVDVVFLPSVDVMYPPGATTFVDVGPLGEVLEGAVRPGHFRGVATVVTKLFAMVEPHRAYFGQKDGQQSVVVRRLARDLGLPVEVVICPTIREPDGLALSSRNRYLTAQEREQAPLIYLALQAASSAAARGETSADNVRRLMLDALAPATLGVVDYVSIADADTLEELFVIDRPALASLAVKFPSARLIDCQPVG
jgi:pantoate--beta-alanine ligase